MKRCGVVLIWRREDHLNASPVDLVLSDRMLLVLGRQSGKWGFPKGHEEQGETEATTAVRELREETGIVLDVQDLGNKIRFRNNIYFLVHLDSSRRLCSRPSTGPLTLPLHSRHGDIDQQEIQELAWFTLQEVLTIPVTRCNFGLQMFIKRFLIPMTEPAQQPSSPPPPDSSSSMVPLPVVPVEDSTKFVKDLIDPDGADCGSIAPVPSDIR